MRSKYLFLLSILFIFITPVSTGAYRHVVKPAYRHYHGYLFNFQENSGAYLAENKEEANDRVNKMVKESQGNVRLSDELEEEYRTLLEEKKKLEDNRSFQKRKKKRKYKHRPYIKELIEKERRITERLEEIEKLRKAVSKEK